MLVAENKPKTRAVRYETGKVAYLTYAYNLHLYFLPYILRP